MYSIGTLSGVYRDSPSPTSARRQLTDAAKLKVPVATTLRFDNDSSDDEAEDPSPAGAVSGKAASASISSHENVASASEHTQHHNPRSGFPLRDLLPGTGVGSCTMESNDYVVVPNSRKRRSNNADSFDLLDSMSQKIRKMGVRQTPSIDSVIENVRHSPAASSEADANSSDPPLFEAIRGQPRGYTFTNANLGSGHFGVVNIAVREYAVKVVDGKNTAAVHQYHEAVALLRRVNHENVIRMNEAFHDVDNDIYYVVFEKMEGSVAEFIYYNRGHFTEQHALVILRCTANALDYLHKLGFVHRDVKSDNVLVGSNGEVKLADLDCAAAENAGLDGTAGTPQLVAPEVARIFCELSDAPYTAKVDVWSFAIFATEFALGLPPYFIDEKEPIHEVCARVCDPEYAACVNAMMRQAIYPEVAKVVKYCLKANPAERPRMSEVLTVMSFLAEPDRRVLLEPIRRMVRRKEANRAEEEERRRRDGSGAALNAYDCPDEEEEAGSRRSPSASFAAGGPTPEDNRPVVDLEDASNDTTAQENGVVAWLERAWRMI